MQSPPSVCPSVSTLSFEPTDFGLDLLHVCGHYHGSQGLKPKVTDQGQDAISMTSILDRGEFYSD